MRSSLKKSSKKERLEASLTSEQKELLLISAEIERKNQFQLRAYNHIKSINNH